MPRSYADIVSKLLRQDAPLPLRFPADRAPLVAAVERGLRARRRRQQMVRWTMTASAAAAALILVMGGRTLLSPYTPAPIAGATSSSHGLRILGSTAQQGASGVMIGAGATVPLAEGMALPQGFLLVAPTVGEVRVGAERGTTLALEGGGELAIREASIMQRYELRVGAVRARVAKLVPGERFIIATTDAEVEVHGTAFRVAVVPADSSCGAGTITRVSVTEGVVSVRRNGVEVHVTPGHVWPERCETPTAATASGLAVSRRVRANTGGHRAAMRPTSGIAAPGPAASPRAPSVDPPAPAAPSEVAQPVSAPLTRSELAAQNDLFASAVRAKRRGQGSNAVRIFERFTRLYPAGPLSESAVSQRMKLLVVIDAAAARRAATEYLARYPAGFARAEAQHLLDIP